MDQGVSEPLLIPAFNASAWTGPGGNNTWLLRGRVPVLIDAGAGKAEHVEALAAALAAAPLARVLITHGHSDHTGGIPALQARWPSVAVISSAEASIDAGDTRLRAIATPGHSPDHVCYFDDSSGDLFCGDLVRIGGSIVIPASQGGDVAQYLESLRLVRNLAPRRLLPGHGPIVIDPAALIDQYIHHREEREGQVIDALHAGLTTAAEIARRIYGRLPDPLVNAAADTIQAHLNKLASEGPLSRFVG